MSMGISYGDQPALTLLVPLLPWGQGKGWRSRQQRDVYTIPATPRRCPFSLCSWGPSTSGRPLEATRDAPRSGDVCKSQQPGPPVSNHHGSLRQLAWARLQNCDGCLSCIRGTRRAQELRGLSTTSLCREPGR